MFLVYGPSAAASHASKAPTGPNLPAPRPPEARPPVHLHSSALPGPAVGAQVYRGGHCIPRHGKEKGHMKDKLTPTQLEADRSYMVSWFPPPLDLGSGGSEEGHGLSHLPA